LGLGKALGFSLLAYVGLNFLFVIISRTINNNLNTLFSDITSNPLIIVLIWMLTCLIGSSAIGVLAFINPGALLYYGIVVSNLLFLLITISISAAINGVFYGAFALLFSKNEMY